MHTTSFEDAGPIFRLLAPCPYGPLGSAGPNALYEDIDPIVLLEGTGPIVLLEGSGTNDGFEYVDCCSSLSDDIHPEPTELPILSAEIGRESVTGLREIGIVHV